MTDVLVRCIPLLFLPFPLSYVPFSSSFPLQLSLCDPGLAEGFFLLKVFHTAVAFSGVSFLGFYKQLETIVTVTDTININRIEFN